MSVRRLWFPFGSIVGCLPFHDLIPIKEINKQAYIKKIYCVLLITDLSMPDEAALVQQFFKFLITKIPFSELKLKTLFSWRLYPSDSVTG